MKPWLIAAITVLTIILVAIAVVVRKRQCAAGGCDSMAAQDPLHAAGLTTGTLMLAYDNCDNSKGGTTPGCFNLCSSNIPRPSCPNSTQVRCCPIRMDCTDPSNCGNPTSIPDIGIWIVAQFIMDMVDFMRVSNTSIYLDKLHLIFDKFTDGKLQWYLDNGHCDWVYVDDHSWWTGMWIDAYLYQLPGDTYADQYLQRIQYNLETFQSWWSPLCGGGLPWSCRPDIWMAGPNIITNSLQLCNLCAIYPHVSPDKQTLYKSWIKQLWVYLKTTSGFLGGFDGGPVTMVDSRYITTTSACSKLRDTPCTGCDWATFAKTNPDCASDLQLANNCTLSTAGPLIYTIGVCIGMLSVLALLPADADPDPGMDYMGYAFRMLETFVYAKPSPFVNPSNGVLNRAHYGSSDDPNPDTIIWPGIFMRWAAKACLNFPHASGSKKLARFIKKNANYAWVNARDSNNVFARDWDIPNQGSQLLLFGLKAQTNAAHLMNANAFVKAAGL